MHFKMPSALCFNFDQSKILSFGYGLRGKKNFSFLHLYKNSLTISIPFKTTDFCRACVNKFPQKYLKCPVNKSDTAGNANQLLDHF